MANVIDTFCEMQRKQLDDFMLAEQVQRLEMCSNQIRAQREMEECRQKRVQLMFRQLLLFLLSSLNSHSKSVSFGWIYSFEGHG